MNNNDLCIKIPPYKINIFSNPIRNKNDCVSILLETVENFIYHNEAIKEIQNNTMLLQNGRLFVFLENKYDNGKYFKDVKKELRTVEQFIFKTFERKKLDSIVVQIVRAIEDKRPKKVYKAPFMQAKLVKIYSMFKS